MSSLNLEPTSCYQIKVHLLFVVGYQGHFLMFHFENTQVNNHAPNHPIIAGV